MEDLSKVLYFFDKLEAPYFCEFDHLKRCFRLKIKKCHPDRGASENEAREVISSFKELEKIYKDQRLMMYYKSLFEKNSSLEEREVLNFNEGFGIEGYGKWFFYRFINENKTNLLKFAGWVGVLGILVFFMRDLVSLVLAILVILATVYLYNKVL
ncbi:MAG: J domain-containing protein [Brevinematia bacterium]